LAVTSGDQKEVEKDKPADEPVEEIVEDTDEAEKSLTVQKS